MIVFEDLPGNTGCSGVTRGRPKIPTYKLAEAIKRRAQTCLWLRASHGRDRKRADSKCA